MRRCYPRLVAALTSGGFGLARGRLGGGEPGEVVVAGIEGHPIGGFGQIGRCVLMALSQTGNAFGIGLLMSGDTLAVALLLPVPAIQFIEDRDRDGGDEPGSAADGAFEVGMHFIGVVKQYEDCLAEVFALAGFDQTDGEIGSTIEIFGDRQDFGYASGDFGVGIGESVEEGG